MKRLIAALLLLAQAAWAGNELGGRLFHSAQQRARLDQIRQQNLAVDRQNGPLLTLDGEVRRSSGRHSHWINGEIRPGRAPASRQQRIGDRIDATSGAAHGWLGDNQLSVKQPPPP